MTKKQENKIKDQLLSLAKTCLAQRDDLTINEQALLLSIKSFELPEVKSCYELEIKW